MIICPSCKAENKDDAEKCLKCREDIFSQPQTEWRSNINQLAQGYRTAGRGLAHGLQKDAVQNSWGARKRDKGWHCKFDLVKSLDGKNILMITDEGTHGLTGKVYDDANEIPDTLPATERLARFENMNFSGGNEGPGLYGRGKLIFQACSKTLSIIYDSKIEGVGYRLNRRFVDGRKLKQFKKVLLDEEAKETLNQLTGGSIRPLTEVGTRIIIIDPIEEVVEAINSGAFLNFISETWWEIIHNYSACISVTVNGTTAKAECPSVMQKLVESKFNKENFYLKENQQVSSKGERYRIKRLVMAKTDNLAPEGLQGVYVQRKGMQIGTIDLKEMPSDLADYLIGFIQLDRDYEEAIAKVENLEHYGFDNSHATYRELKKTVQANFELFKKQLGYDLSAEKNNDERARRAMRLAEEKLSQVMKDLGLPGLGKIKLTNDISVSLENVDFPYDSSRVELGDKVENIKFRINNRAARTFDLNVRIETKDNRGNTMEILFDKDISIEAKTVKIMSAQTINVQKKLYQEGQTFTCSCAVFDRQGKALSSSKFPIYVGSEPHEVLDPIAIKLDSINYPKDGSTRVDFGQSLENIGYTIQNNTSHKLNLRFTVRTERDEDTEIEQVLEKDFKIDPYSEDEIKIPQIQISEKKYSIAGEGAVFIRSKVVSLIEQHGFKKGKKLAKHIIRFWLNQDDPGLGIFEERITFNGGAESPRSKVQIGSAPGRWVFMLNVTHPYYETVSDKRELMDAYLYELLAREALYIALYGEVFEVFQNTITPNDDLHEVAAAHNVALDRVLASYYR